MAKKFIIVSFLFLFSFITAATNEMPSYPEDCFYENDAEDDEIVYRALKEDAKNEGNDESEETRNKKEFYETDLTDLVDGASGLAEEEDEDEEE